MNTSDLEKYTQWFNDYVVYHINAAPELSENIKIKADHCHHVSERIFELGKELKLNVDDLSLARFIGLFHDVGRFEQYLKYQTFSDSEFQNHAELGIKVITENEIFHEIDHKEKEIIRSAIRNHSTAVIEPDLSERALLFSKLIRDADKMDIYRLIVDYYNTKEPGDNSTIELELPNDPSISPGVLSAIMNNKMVRKEDMKTLNDFKILQIGWIFDLNYDFTFNYIVGKGFISKIFETLPKIRQISDIAHKVNLYIENVIKTT